MFRLFHPQVATAKDLDQRLFHGLEGRGTEGTQHTVATTHLPLLLCIVTDIHLEHNLEKIKQDRCRERTSHLEHHQISHLEHPVLY